MKLTDAESRSLTEVLKENQTLKGIADARLTHITELEAALREIADFAEQFIGDDEDGDERMYKVHQIADSAIPFASSESDEQ